MKSSVPSLCLNPRWALHPGWVAGVFGVSLLTLVVQHQLADPSWTPHGADWDTWYQSILSLTHSGVAYPPNRWPLYAIYGALFGLLPGPLHVNAQVASMAAAAGSIAALFLVARTLLGFYGALTAAALTLTFPIVVHLSSWISSYPLWATGALWSVAGMVEALRTGRPGWWVVSGAGAAVVLAVMAKGLGIGLIVLALIAVFSVLEVRHWLRNLSCVLLPLALMSVLYIAFPSPLLTLQAQIDMAEMTPTGGMPHAPTGGMGHAPPPAQPPPVVSDRSRLFEGGYVFGRSMGPVQLYRTLTKAQSTSSDPSSRLTQSLGKLHRSFPSVGQPLLRWLLLGAGMGLLSGLARLLVQGRRDLSRACAPLAGWLGLAGIIAGTLPALLSVLSTRFLTPSFFVIALFVVAPVALLSRWTAWTAWLPLLLVPLALIPGTPWSTSPWRATESVRTEMQSVEIPGHQALWVRHVLLEQYPTASLFITAPADQGLLALADHPGRLANLDVRFFEMPPMQPLASEYVLLSTLPDGVSHPVPDTVPGEVPVPPMPDFDKTRPVVWQQAWPTSTLILYGPEPTEASTLRP